MIDGLAKLLGYVMKGCYWLTNNYVLALLLFALAMQLLLFPLGIKQQKNMVRQSKMRPKEMAIRKKYAGRNDQATMKKMNMEIQELYQKEGYSPLAGCLPMLIQLIIIFPLYQVVVRPLEFLSGFSKEICENIAQGLYGADVKITSTMQIKVISSLRADPSLVSTLSEDAQTTIATAGGVEKLPNVSLFGLDLGQTPWEALGTAAWALVFIPILNLVLMYVSQFLTKKLSYQNTQAEAMGSGGAFKIMMYILPLFTAYITFTFASAIGIYWIFRTVLAVIQQVVLYKMFPYPKFDEEDYKKAERELKGKTYTKKDAGNYVVQPGEYHSLHHDDDE